MKDKDGRGLRLVRSSPHGCEPERSTPSPSTDMTLSSTRGIQRCYTTASYRPADTTPSCTAANPKMRLTADPVPDWVARIKALMSRLNLTQYKLAKKMCLSQTAVSRWLSRTKKGRREPSPMNYIWLGALARGAERRYFWDRASFSLEAFLAIANDDRAVSPEWASLAAVWGRLDKRRRRELVEIAETMACLKPL